MTTLSDLRTKVRTFIKDTGASQKVENTELDDYLLYALSDYSTHFPLRKVLEVDPPTATIAAPSDMVPGENSVEFIEVSSAIWSQWKVEEGVSLPITGKYWYWRGGSVAFPSVPASAVSIWYLALHPFPAADDVEFTVPLADQELLVVYAAALFHEKVGTIAAKLDRFKESGKRDDNPLVLMHEVLFARYDKLVASRMPTGTIHLRRSNG
jgi:hypothetical protein